MSIISPPLILASKSAVRRDILERAGVDLSDIIDSAIDESVFHDDFSHDMYGLSLALACKKGCVVSSRRDGSLVIGCDQCLIFEDDLVHKSSDTDSLRATLKRLRGHTHCLVSSVSCCMDGSVLWSYTDLARMRMRRFSDHFLDDYIDRYGAAALNSVGGYQFEGIGAQLLSSAEGDYFTILGLPLLPLLDYLRMRGCLPS